MNSIEEPLHPVHVSRSIRTNIIVICIKGFKSTYDTIKIICTYVLREKNVSIFSDTELIVMRIIPRTNQIAQLIEC